MEMRRKVLLPLDGSEFGRLAFGTVRRLFEPESTDVIVAHVTRMPEGVVFGTLPPLSAQWGESLVFRGLDLPSEAHTIPQSQVWASTKEEIIDAFDDDVRELRAMGYQVSLEVRAGEPAQELADLVDERDVDAVVMATHGRSGPSRALLGSVAERLLRMVVVPVVMARGHRGTSEPHAWQRHS
jgi:nucleotide-binding universal stress UspA family protein